MYKESKLSNGIKLITKEIAGSKSATVLCLVGAGSRYEKESERGISHFLEHMFFKGGGEYKTAKDVAQKIDSIGGDFNAFTGKEYAGYYVKCATNTLDTAYDVLSDMLIRAKFEQSEVDKEKGVILEELNMYQDTPMYQVSWNFENFVLGNQPLGWDTIGKKEVISSVTQEDFKRYKESLYVPENTVISVAGGIKHEDVYKDVEKFFASLSGRQTRHFDSIKDYIPESRVQIQDKKTEQAHFVLGGKAPEAKHEDAFILKVLSVLTGGMMSSRMFLNVREAQGLCYYISTSTDDFLDTGLISTRAGVDLSRLQIALKAVLEEYRKLREERVPSEELEKAKNFLKGKMKLRMEDSEENAHMLGKQALLYGEILSLDEVTKRIDAVTSEDLLRVASQVFAAENLYLSIIGPFLDKKAEIENLMKG